MNSPQLCSTQIAFVAASMALAFAQPVHSQDVAGTVDDPMYVAGDYQVFTGDGQPVSLDDVIAAMGRHEVVFIGETHDDPTGHALELELFRRAHETYGISGDEENPGRPVAASLEFFEQDAQLVVDEYLAGKITESAFKAASRPWPRYETDYRGLIEYAKEQGLAIVAANAPRRYANMATRLGRASLEDLSESARATLAPLPYGRASRPYLDQWVQVMMDQTGPCGVPADAPTLDPEPAQHSEDTTNEPTRAHGSGGGSALDAQVLWDATMAYWVTDHLIRNPDALVLHMVGSFHVARGTGIPEQFLTYRPGSSSMIIMMRAVDDVNEFEAAPSGEWGDFVIQTQGSRTLEVLACQAGSP